MTLYLGNNLISGVAYPTEPTRNLGQIIESIVPLTDAGLHLLDGSLINGSGIYSDFVTAIGDIYDGGNYPDLFETEANWQSAVTTYGVCGKFVYDSVGNTVRLPKITGIVEGTTDANALGDLIQQYVKLPNITGNVSWTANGYVSGTWGDSSANNTATGPFKLSDSGKYGGIGASGSDKGNGANINFDASRSSSVYSGNGSDTKIQPQAIKVLYYIVIATTTKTEIEVDIDQIATDLNGKADVDLTNVNNSGTSLGAKWAMPSGKRTQLTVGASGTTYTAPANGYFAYNSFVSGAWISLSVNGMLAISQKVNSIDMSGFVPVKKGDVASLSYDGSWSPHNWQSNIFVFIYAKGSESEAS